MAADLVNAFVGAGRLQEATAFLRQLCLSVPVPIVEPYRREVVQQMFRQAELARAERAGLARGFELRALRAEVSAALLEISEEIEGIIGSDVMQRHADAYLQVLADDATTAEPRPPELPSAPRQAAAARDVFISYCRENEIRARALSEAISQRGVSVWFDRNIAGGERYIDCIQTALDAARAVLVLWTPEAVASDWVLYEARRAHAQGKHVPLLGEGLGVDDLPPPYPAVLHCIPVSSEFEILRALRRLEIRC